MLILNLCYFYYFFIKMIQKDYKEINILKFKKYFSLFLVLILIFSSIPLPTGEPARPEVSTGTYSESNTTAGLM